MKIIVLNINQDTVERGSEIFWKNLSQELESRDAKVTILSGNKPAVQNKSSNIFFKIFRRFYLDFYSLQVLLFTLKNIARIIKEKPNLIIPTNGGWQVLIVRLIRQVRLTGKNKTVLIGHAGIGHDDEFNLKFGGADLFVALTKEQEKWAKIINSKIKITYIPNGVDTDFFKSEGERHEHELEKPIFLTVSSLENYKNIDKTVEAVGNIAKGSLVILGCGREEKNLRILCDARLKGRYLIEKVKHSDLPKYYRGANVFTLVSSHQEAFGLVYLEAMSCGLPVVATRDEKRHEIVGEAGIFVDPNNIEEYKNALMKAVDINWEDKPMRQAEKFSWEKAGKLYFDYFDKIIYNQ